VIVGATIGLNAALISIITAWLSNLKMGYCQQGWWLNEKFCCWEIERSTHVQEGGVIGLGGASGVLGAGGTEEGCEDWQTWTSFGLIRYLAYTFYSVLFSYAAAKLVKTFTPAAAGSGISEIKCILSGFDKPGFLSFVTLVIKSITLPLAIASGLSIGKEGPSVHMAACIGFVLANQFQRFSSSRHKMRELVTAASAAGVAVAFGSPVGGVLFAFEVWNQLAHTTHFIPLLTFLASPVLMPFFLSPSVVGNDHLVSYQDYVAQFLLCFDCHGYPLRQFF
jgi:chloride channel 3/4/5